MNALRSFERRLYKPVSNHNISYPIVSEETFTYMDIMAAYDRCVVMCFPYYMHVGEQVYIDIFIWDVMLPSGYKRLVLEYGYSLKEEDEDIFLKYLYSRNIKIDGQLHEHLAKMVRSEYPDIHLGHYKDERHTLLHLYYTFHKTGPYEILFKSNLNYLAAGLSQMNEYNLIGASPKKIFDIQLGMLRALNSDIGSEILESVENRKLANKLYARYHNMIYGTLINKYQWRYMKERDEQGEIVDEQMYQFLGELSSDRQYYKYLKYMEQKEIVDPYYSILPKYPDLEDLDENFEVCDMIESYIERERDIDNSLKSKAKKYKKIYAYESGDYVVLVPSSLKELLAEAQGQHNCLHKYILRMAYNNTVILFMRKKGKETNSLITIEVEHGVIQQALRTYNHELNEKEEEFLEEYAMAKKLVIQLHDEFDWDDEDWDDED